MPPPLVNAILSLLLCRKQQQSSPVVQFLEEKSHVKTQLPCDIIVEIFSRLPVKSLLRCRCVCKSWRNLISSNHFVNKHLHQSNKNNDNNLILLRGCKKLRVVDYVSLSVPLELDFKLFGIRDIEMMCSCNGLLCILEYTGWTWVLNPCTRKYKILPRCPNEVYSNKVLGFAYDSSSDDYLIFRVFSNEPDYSSVEIYSFNKKSWTSMEGIPYTVDIFNRVATLLDRPTVTDSTLHWVGNYRIKKPTSTLTTTTIVAFNLRSKSFYNVQLPRNIARKNQVSFFDTSQLNRCLCLYFCSVGILGVWVMKEYGVRESWVKLYNIWNTRIHSKPFMYYMPDSKKREFIVRRLPENDLRV